MTLREYLMQWRDLYLWCADQHPDDAEDYLTQALTVDELLEPLRACQAPCLDGEAGEHQF